MASQCLYSASQSPASSCPPKGIILEGYFEHSRGGSSFLLGSTVKYLSTRLHHLLTQTEMKLMKSHQRLSVHIPTWKMKSNLYTHKERDPLLLGYSNLFLLWPQSTDPPTRRVELHKLLAAPGILENTHPVRSLPKCMSLMAITRFMPVGTSGSEGCNQILLALAGSVSQLCNPCQNGMLDLYSLIPSLTCHVN